MPLQLAYISLLSVRSGLPPWLSQALGPALASTELVACNLLWLKTLQSCLMLFLEKTRDELPVHRSQKLVHSRPKKALIEDLATITPLCSRQVHFQGPSGTFDHN